jgi:hypothetical protein
MLWSLFPPGPFTEDEDNTILQQLAELGIPVDGEGAGEAAAAVTYPSGFWEELSAQLNRPPEILRARVRNMRNRGISL